MKVNPEMVIKDTFSKTKNMFHKAFRNLKSLVSNKLVVVKSSPNQFPFNGIKVQRLEEFYTSFSGRWKTNPIPSKQEEDGIISKCSNNGADYSRRFEENTRKIRGSKRFESGYLAAEALAKRMKELEMMDVNDMDHVLDVEEALHYYSRLTCPAYQDIVDKFFMDMYLEFHEPEPEPEPGPVSRELNASMRKLGSGSLHSSMRSLGPIKL